MGNVRIKKLVLVGVIVFVLVATIAVFLKKLPHEFSSIQLDSQKHIENMTEIHNFLLELDQDMAKAFSINLNEYRRIEIMFEEFMTPEDKKLDLVDIRTQIEPNYGDVYSIYLNKDGTQSIALKQDLNGVYTLYQFKKLNINKWELSNTNMIQGEYRFINDYFVKNHAPQNEVHLIKEIR